MDEAKQPTNRRGKLRTAVVALLVAAFGWSLYGLGRAQGADETPAPVQTDEPAAAVAERLAPSVVRIEHPGGQGSGVVYDEGGLILTAGHVVEGVTEVTVRSAADEALSGEVVGSDPATDVAVVDVDGDLPVPELGSDDDLRVGQLAVAIGSPYGLDESVTLGIVSALDREVTTEAGTISGVVQTDAPINPGSSGGPLADKEGRVIGINHAIASSSGGNEGVGFAIPIGVALDSAEEIRDGDGEEPGHGLMPDMPFPDIPPLEEWDGPLGEGFLEPAPECFGGEAPRVPGFAPFTPMDGPDVPAPRYLPDGWDTVSVMTNRIDGDSDVLYEVELAGHGQRMTITLGNNDAVVDRAESIEGRAGTEGTEVNGGAATLVEDGGRLYLVFEHDDLTGIVDAPADLGTAELLRVVESIR